MKSLRWAGSPVLLALACCSVQAQEAAASFEVPVAIGGDAIFTHRLQSGDPSDRPFTGGFRVVVSPALRLGRHWFFYSAVQVNSNQYFYYDAFSGDGPFTQVHALQAFAGYTTTIGKASLLIKAGQLSSAFGSFPLQYDDAKNPLIDQPLGYVNRLPIRADQIPCGVRDLLSQNYGGDVVNYCGGSTVEGYGILPATLYGLIGIEAELSLGRMDARLQLTNSSPANPLAIDSRGQYLQWAAGGGYSIRSGLRVGVSAFRGPYMDSALNSLLPAGKMVRDFPATGIGADVQWSRGRWVLNGEWQRFQFDSPNFAIAPALNVSYAEIKRILTPRAFVAVRVGFETFGRVGDLSGVSAAHWATSQQVNEVAFGFRPNRYQLIKAGYEWVRGAGAYGTLDNVVGIQLVTTVTPVSLALQ
jgi:hypothetical protein